MIGQLAPAFKEGQGVTDPLDYIEVLRDRRAINERFAELQDEIKDEILVFTKPPYATPPQEEEKGLEVTATHTARSVYEFSIFDDPATIEGVRRFIEAGEDGRFVEQLPLKLVIIDERYVMFGMEDPVAGGSELTMVVVEHPSLAATMQGRVRDDLGAGSLVRRGVQAPRAGHAVAARIRSARAHADVRLGGF